MPPFAMSGVGQFQFALIPSIFGGIAVEGAAAEQILNLAPAKIIGFDHIRPDFSTDGIYPEGMICNHVEDSLHVLAKGLYVVSFRINATVPAGSAFVFTVYINGVATAIKTAQNLSNQSDFFTASLNSRLYLEADDLVTLWGKADQDARSFVMQDSELFLQMVR